MASRLKQAMWLVRAPGQLRSKVAAVALLGALLSGCDDSAPTSPDQPVQVNHAPVLYEPHASAYHDKLYQQRIVAWDRDGDSVAISADTLPGWLVFDTLGFTLSGIAGEENIGDHRVLLVATDGRATTRLGFTLTVRVGTSSLIFDGSWILGLGLLLGHDGHPYRSENFVVYSGFSSMEARQFVAELAEQDYVEIQTVLATGDHEFEWRGVERTIDIFANKLQWDIGGGMAYEEGIVVRAWDASDDWWTADSARYENMVKHELTHVVQGLLIGAQFPLNSPDAWFTEGVAEYVAGSIPDAVTSRSQLEQWRQSHLSYRDGGNPIAVHRWEDLPPEILEAGRAYTYYPYFELAFRYLVDPAGHGKTLSDVKNIYFDIRSGMSFSESFAARMGMTVRYYEGRFFALLAGYLSN